ncbi:MAG: 5-oxoprolinase subunit PxpA [Chthoniobacteraceae bacterium]
MRLDLNADLGEGCANDAEILSLVTSANIACGFHAGDAETMWRTLERAKKNGVTVGAHPSFADRAEFGRRELPIPPGQLFAELIYQLGAFAELARAMGLEPQHVKPHGALYNLAAREAETADVVVRSVVSANPKLILFAPPGSVLARTASEYQLRVAREVFADRNYHPDGTLVPRSHPHALLTDAESAAARMVSLLTDGSLPSIDGTPLMLEADTVCVHGDSPQAVAFTRTLRAALVTAGVALRSPAA